MSWSESHVRGLAPLIAACVLSLLAAPAAHADFTPVTAPAGALSADGFAISQGAWMVGLTGSAPPAVQASMSHDHGQSWVAVALPTGPSSSLGRFSGVSVGPDGAFYVAARYPIALAPGTFARVLRIAPDSGAVTIASTLPLPDAGAALGAPAFDAQGRMWVAWVPSGSATFTLARIAGGAVAESYQAPAPSTASANGEIQFRPSGMWVRMGNTTYRLSGGELVVAPQGMPTLEDGQLVLTRDHISFDGGQSFALGQGANAVEGDPTLMAGSSGIIRRYSPVFFSATAQTWAPNAYPLINRAIATDGGLLAFEDEWRQPQAGAQGWRMLWHPGPVTDPPFATGPLSSTFTSWLTEANGFRAQAGLPPLLGDSAIATAAENHSRYWTLNPWEGDAHYETPGAPGFTGASPSDRCAAAGAPASCSEVMYAGDDPIAWWVSTAYHRTLVMTPTALTVGGGRVPGGVAVMDAGAGGGLLVGPVVFPKGAYSGPLEHDGENPDAATQCRSAGQPVTAPLGPAVSVSVPQGTATLSGFTLSPAGGQPLPSCVLGGLLLTDDPLLPSTTYDATVLWQPTPQMAAQRISWQFTTAAGVPWGQTPPPPQGSTTPPPPPPPLAFAFGLAPPTAMATPAAPRSTCRPSLSRTASRATRGRAIGVRIRACGPGVATVGVYRRNPRTAAQRRALTRRSVAVHAAGTTTLRLGTRILRPGRYALRITLKAAQDRKLDTSITVVRAAVRR